MAADVAKYMISFAMMAFLATGFLVNNINHILQNLKTPKEARNTLYRQKLDELEISVVASGFFKNGDPRKLAKLLLMITSFGIYVFYIILYIMAWMMGRGIVGGFATALTILTVVQILQTVFVDMRKFRASIFNDFEEDMSTTLSRLYDSYYEIYNSLLNFIYCAVLYFGSILWLEAAIFTLRLS